MLVRTGGHRTCKRPSVALGLVVVLGLLVLGSCGSDEEGKEGTLILYETVDPTTLDPARSWGIFDGLVCSMIFSGLVRLDEEGNVQLDLAEYYEVAENQTAFTFLLREDAHFPSGDPITSFDVKASFERVMHPDTRSGTTWVLERILGAKEFAESVAAQKQGDSPVVAPPIRVFGKPRPTAVEGEADTMGFDPNLFVDLPGLEKFSDTLTTLDADLPYQVTETVEFDPLYLDGIPGIETVPPPGLAHLTSRWLRIRLEEPYAPFLSLLAMPAALIVGATDVREVEDIGMSFEEHPQGSGPWKLDHWTHDQEIVLVPNEEYWGDQPELTRVKFRILPTDSTAVGEFRTGLLDVLDVPVAEVRLWRDDEEWKDHCRVIDQLNIEFLAFNCRRKPFDDLRVRKAFVHAVDVKTLLETVREGLGTKAHGAIPPGLPGYVPEGKDPIEYDVEKAKELLMEAGYPDGLDCEILLTGMEGSVRTYMEAIQGMLREAGIRVKLARAEWSTFRELRNQNKFDIAFYNWYADYPDADNFLYPLFHSDQTKRYKNERFDSLLLKAQQAPNTSAKDLLLARAEDAKKSENKVLHKLLTEMAKNASDESLRVQLYRKADKTLYEDCAAIFLWHRSIMQVVNPRVREYREPVIFNGTRFMEVYVK